MERQTSDDTEKDRKMKSSFERQLGDVEESNKKKKKKKHSGADAFVTVEKEKKDESEKSADAKATDEEAAADKKDTTWDLFEKKDTVTDEESPESEPEVPENPEELSDGEAKLVTKQLVEARGDELEQDIVSAESDSPEEAELLANAAFIDKVSEKLETEEQVDDAVLDQAVAEVVEELEIQPEASETEELDVETEVEIEEFVPAEALEPDPVEMSEEAAAEDDDSAVSVSHSASTVPPVPPTPTVPVSAMGGANIPSTPTQNFVPNFSPQPSSPNVITPLTAAPERNKYGRGADMLVGGIIGYLVGRRRGRIKTEERLIPVQKSLEKKVKDLDEKITIREQKIRTLTSEKVAREGEDARKSIAEKVEAKAQAKLEARDKVAEQRLADKTIVRREVQEQTVPAFVQEQEVSRVAAVPEIPEPIEEDMPARLEVSSPETSEILQQQRPEKLASVVLASPELAELRPAETIRSVVSKETAKEVVQKMPEAELLVAAAKIEVDGQNAKQLYEQGRVSKEDLREVVVEHVRGNGRAERLLVERLRPAASSETMERLPREGRHGQAQDDASGGGAASLPPVQPGGDDEYTQSGTNQGSIRPAADQSTHLAKQTKSKAPVAWVTGIVIAASIAASLFL
jgi:hypothetical protein